MSAGSNLLLTMGDPAGVGPEVALKALPSLMGHDFESIGCVGPLLLWEMAAEDLGISPPQKYGVDVIPAGTGDLGEGLARELLFSGRVTADSVRLVLDGLETASGLAASNPDGTAIVTGPVSKRAIREFGLQVPGLTEWFASRFDVDTPLMLLVGGAMRVALLTTHMPLVDVPGALSVDTVVERLEILRRGLKERFGVAEPAIALLALNPHGGLDGEPAREEREILHPAVEEARAKGVEVEGPFSADSFFGRRDWQGYDAVVAPYHDQGLIPVKTEAAGAGVNVTLGLPVVRTAPDHGTAFDIAGRGIASERAFVAAAELAGALLEGKGASWAP